MPRAIAWMVLSGLSFALMGAMVKFAGDIALPAKVFFRNLVTLAVAWAVLARSGSSPLAPSAHWPRLLGRSVCGLLGVTLYFHAIGHLHLADASLLNKTSPFFVSVFAVVFLRERFARGLAPALLVAFVGAVLVIKPRFDYAMLPALAGLGSGMFAGMAYTFVRSLKGRENPSRIVLVFSAVSCLATAPFLVADPPSPSAAGWAALVGTGVFAAGGQYGLTYAYHHARASRISLFTFLHVLFALVVGFVFWGERPDAASLLGGTLIVGAAVAAHRITAREARAAG